MSKHASDNIFRLIKSLTRAEKRYFKVYSGRYLGEGKGVQLQLFDAIDAQEEYDETALVKKFRNSAFGKTPAIVKNRLYETILRSLHSFHSDSSLDVELQRLVHSAEILFKKSLYQDAERMLSRARKLALKHEKFYVLLEINKWDKRLLEKNSYAGSDTETIALMHRADRELIEKLINYSDFWNIKSRLFMLLNQKGKVRDTAGLNSFKNIIDNTLMKSEGGALSYETRYLYYHIYSAYYFGIGDYANSYAFIKKHLDLIEQNAELFEEEPNKYFAVLSNMIYLCTQLRKFDEVPGYLDKLKSIPKRHVKKMNEDMSIKLFSSALSAELSFYIQTGVFDKAIELVPEIERGIRKYGDKLSKVRIAFFYFNVAIVFFALNDFNTALKWINRLLNDGDIDSNQDIHCMGRILSMIIHLEIGHHDLIPYTIRSTQRYLTSRKRTFRFETLFLQFINRLAKAKTDEARRECYRLLRPELRELSLDPFEKSVFEYFDFITWVEASYHKVPFREMVKRKQREG